MSNINALVLENIFEKPMGYYGGHLMGMLGRPLQFGGMMSAATGMIPAVMGGFGAAMGIDPSASAAAAQFDPNLLTQNIGPIAGMIGGGLGAAGLGTYFKNHAGEVIANNTPAATLVADHLAQRAQPIIQGATNLAKQAGSAINNTINPVIKPRQELGKILGRPIYTQEVRPSTLVSRAVRNGVSGLKQKVAEKLQPLRDKVKQHYDSLYNPPLPK